MAAKACTISMPEEFVEEVDEFAARHHRTRSGLIQEALRQYMSPPPVVGTPWLRQLYDMYAPAREEIRALGLTEDEIGCIIDEEIAAYREEKRAKRGG